MLPPMSVSFGAARLRGRGHTLVRDRRRATQAAVVNTLELGVMTATVGAVMVALLAYVANRKIILGHQVLGFLALAPIVIPGVVLQRRGEYGKLREYVTILLTGLFLSYLGYLAVPAVGSKVCRPT